MLDPGEKRDIRGDRPLFAAHEIESPPTVLLTLRVSFYTSRIVLHTVPKFEIQISKK